MSGPPGCVEKICDVDPECCESVWHAGCAERVLTECQIECATNQETGECTACYLDSTDPVDHDGDGFSPAEGDCRECDPSINPQAFDFPTNGLDDDCDGNVDNGTESCDATLTADGDANDHAKAIGMCKASSAGSWGLVDARFVRADGVTPCTDNLQYRILEDFGAASTPREGRNMAVYSSGTARDRDDSGFRHPDGNRSSYSVGTTSTPANPVPGAAGCPDGTPGRDSCGLLMRIKAPVNANSFSYNFKFFTSEYPEWLCTAYNDAFVAYYDGSLNTQADKNISFDSNGNPVSVNNGFFTIPAWPPPTSGDFEPLNGSGYAQQCTNRPGGTFTSPSICGGATDWLFTAAPVAPGEEISLHFSIWDTGDTVWDSAVLIDNFRWSERTSSIVTGVYEEPASAPAPTTFTEGSFLRDYDLSTECSVDETAVWSLWSWSAETPGDSRVEFYVQTALTKAGLDNAPRTPLLFGSSPGPSQLAGAPAVARAGTPDTQTGAALVDEALSEGGLPQNLPSTRITALLIPTTDNLSAPTLKTWNLQASCQFAQ